MDKPPYSPDLLTIVIADDELAARRRLRRLLETEENVSIVGEFSDGQSAVDGIRELNPDVALLDIQMPERDGLEVAEAVSAFGTPPAVAFVTAFDHYALRAFEVHAVDYLVKPVDAGRLHGTLARMRSRASDVRPAKEEFARLARMIDEVRQTQTAIAAGERKRFRDRLLVAVDGSLLVVPAGEIDWIESAGNYARLHRGAHALMMRESLASLESTLDPEVFARVHRGAIVNIEKVKEVQPWFSGASVLILTTGQRLTVSRSHRKQFQARFGVQSDD